VRLPILKLRNVESRWEGHDILELQLDKIKDDQFAEQIQKRVYDPESNDIKRLATDWSTTDRRNLSQLTLVSQRSGVGIVDFSQQRVPD